MPQKSNTRGCRKIAMFKGSYLLQTIISGIHVSFRGVYTYWAEQTMQMQGDLMFFLKICR